MSWCSCDCERQTERARRRRLRSCGLSEKRRGANANSQATWATVRWSSLCVVYARSQEQVRQHLGWVLCNKFATTKQSHQYRRIWRFALESTVEQSDQHFVEETVTLLQVAHAVLLEAANNWAVCCVRAGDCFWRVVGVGRQPMGDGATNCKTTSLG